MKVILVIFALSLTSIFACFTQNNETKQKLQTKKTTQKKQAGDTLFNSYTRLAKFYAYRLPDSSKYYIDLAYQIGDQQNDTFKICESLKLYGVYYDLKSQYELAIKKYDTGLQLIKTFKTKDHTRKLNLISALYVNKGSVLYNQGYSIQAMDAFKFALKIDEKLNNKEVLAIDYSNIALAYSAQAKYAEALDYYLKALKIDQEIGSKSGEASDYANIGLIYDYQKKYVEAEDYFRKALSISQEINNRRTQSVALRHLGSMYASTKKYNHSLDHYQQALKIAQELGNKSSEAKILESLSEIYLKKRQIAQAEKYVLQAIQINSKNNDRDGLVSNYNCLGNIYFHKKDFQHAEKYYQKSVKIGNSINNVTHLSTAYLNLSKLYEKQGDYRQSLEAFKNHIAIQRKINNEENTKKLTQIQLEFEFNKKRIEDSITNSKQLILKNAEIDKKNALLTAKRNQQIALFGGMVLILFFSFIIFKRYQLTKKQKEIIEEKEQVTILQKNIIESKHKEITDSIHYAERIQRNFLASQERLKEKFKEHFIFYKPKDVVSGDFYWSTDLANACVAFCCADSTGHGVPGAIMSILNITSLEKAVESEVEPSKILDRVQESIIKNLVTNSKNVGSGDGMDCCLVSFDFTNNQITYSGAKNPLWVVRNNELIELANDRISLGHSEINQNNFSQNKFEIISGDIIYMSTDGFPDQFGGEKGKKYKHKQLKEFLISISHLPLNEQKSALEEELTQWMRSQEQIDDVCIVGIKI